jgi:hypothetical protein
MGVTMEDYVVKFRKKNQKDECHIEVTSDDLLVAIKLAKEQLPNHVINVNDWCAVSIRPAKERPAGLRNEDAPENAQ